VYAKGERIMKRFYFKRLLTYHSSGVVEADSEDEAHDLSYQIAPGDCFEELIYSESMIEFEELKESEVFDLPVFVQDGDSYKEKE
jgi:hypothetical protein